MHKSIICLLLSFLFALSAFADGFILVIDPGHGGKDSGTVRGTYQEKKIVLAVATAFGKMVEDNMKGVNVLYTRKSDVFVPLDKRAALANKNKANLFISIHVNSTGSKATSANGVETYALGFSKSEASLAVAKRENEVIKYEDNYKQKYEGFDPNSPESYIIFEFMNNEFLNQSLDFARNIQRNMKSIAKRTDRGARQENFLVLRDVGMPSVLVELGFINNNADALYISSAAGQKKLAESLYAAFREYKAKYDSRQGNGTVNVSQNTVLASQTEEVSVPVSKVENKVPTPVSTPKVTVSSKVTATPKVTQSTNAKPKKDEIEYRIQFYYSRTQLPANSPKLKGIENVKFYKDGSGYKYTAGSTTNFNEAVKIQKKVREKYKDAFVIRFKNGVRQ